MEAAWQCMLDHDILEGGIEGAEASTLCAEKLFAEHHRLQSRIVELEGNLMRMEEPDPNRNSNPN